MVGVHTASATAKKRKWRILNPGPHTVENVFSKYVFSKYAVYHRKALEKQQLL